MLGVPLTRGVSHSGMCYVNDETLSNIERRLRRAGTPGGETSTDNRAAMLLLATLVER